MIGIDAEALRAVNAELIAWKRRELRRQNLRPAWDAIEADMKRMKQFIAETFETNFEVENDAENRVEQSIAELLAARSAFIGELQKRTTRLREILKALS